MAPQLAKAVSGWEQGRAATKKIYEEEEKEGEGSATMISASDTCSQDSCEVRCEPNAS